MRCKRILAGVLSAAMVLTATSVPGTADAADNTPYITKMPGVEKVTESSYNSSFLSVTGFAENAVNDRTSVIGTSKYRVVNNEEEFLQALADAKRNRVDVIEIAADLDLGWNALSQEAKNIGVATEYGWEARVEIYNPAIIESGVSQLNIADTKGLTIFSRAGNTVKHAEWKLQGTSSDIVIRNIKFDDMWTMSNEKEGDTKALGWTLMKLNGVKGVWIDHCTFTLGYDGNMDSENGSSDMTSSWNSYSLSSEEGLDHNGMIYKTVNYLEELYQMGQVGKDSVYGKLREKANGDLEKIMAYEAFHNKFNLNGSGEKDFKDGSGNEDGNQRLHLTMAYNKVTNIGQRFPLLRQGTVAYINCYVDNSSHKAAQKALFGRADGTTGASARAGASVGMDTCVFNEVDRIVTGNEKTIQDAYNGDWGYAFSNALNHTLVVNSKIIGGGKDGSDYIGSSWDNNGDNPFIGNPSDYWNSGKETIDNFKWFSHIVDAESDKYTRGVLPKEPFQLTYDDNLTYSYQRLPLEEVESTLNAYAGAYVFNEGPEFWLRTEYGEEEEFKTVAQKGETTEVTDIDLNVEDGELYAKVGTPRLATADVVPSNADDKTLTWTSSDETVAEVRDYGLIVPKAVGTTTITVKAGNVSKTFEVHVTLPAESVTIGEIPTEIYLGTAEKPAGSLLLEAAVSPMEADQRVTWISSQPKYLKIDENGVMTPLKARNNITITCISVDDPTKTAKVVVNVVEGEAAGNTYTPFVYGDTTGNGVVDILDVEDALRYYLGVKEFDHKSLVAGNVNGSGDIQITDILEILRKVVGLVDQFEVEK